jgi:nucleoside-diphosphate-sugar epimerase
MTILVVGGTGTLGRQIVRELLMRGFVVNCLVRNIRKAEFLREWGATLSYGDLKLPETIPNTLKGITTIIDASTFRAEDELARLEEIDLVAKIALIKAAQVANIKRFIFFSIKDIQTDNSIPFLKLKKKIEMVLKSSKIPYTIFKLSGFYQGLILQYAIPILEQQTIYTTKDSNLNFYINTQDVAKICTKFLIYTEKFSNFESNIIELNGPKNLTSDNIIQLAQEFAGIKANITFIPFFIFSFVKNFMVLSKWGWEVHDRLAFAELLLNNQNSTSALNVSNNFKVYKDDLLSLDDYFEEYFQGMLKKLKDLNYDQAQVSKRKNLIF